MPNMDRFNVELLVHISGTFQGISDSRQNGLFEIRFIRVSEPVCEVDSSNNEQKQKSWLAWSNRAVVGLFTGQSLQSVRMLDLVWLVP